MEVSTGNVRGQTRRRLAASSNNFSSLLGETRHRTGRPQSIPCDRNVATSTFHREPYQSIEQPQCKPTSKSIRRDHTRKQCNIRIAFTVDALRHLKDVAR